VNYQRVRNIEFRVLGREGPHAAVAILRKARVQ
jgi:hypothetical protein